MVKKKASVRVAKKASVRVTILTEGKVRRGGIKSKPSCPKPNIRPVGQKPSHKTEKN